MASPTRKKKCSSCQEALAPDEFYKRAASHDGLDTKCKRCNWKSDMRKQYGLDYEDYLSLFRKQGGACAICRRIEDEGRRTRLSVDHCHYTKKVRGLLCSSCNLGLGKFRDDPQRIQAAADYLRTHGKH